MLSRLLLLLIFCAAAVLCQVDTGTVSGIITDSSGSAAPGARISVLHQETGLEVNLDTNEAGFYSAPALRPGRYTVQVNRDGFRPQRSRPFDLRVQDRVEISF